MGTVHAQRPPRVVPQHQSTVLERLPQGYAELEPLSGRAHPGAPDAVEAAGLLLSTAARSGDARLAARADALLAALPATETDIGVLAARAFAAQHRHAFVESLGFLDTLLAAKPDAGVARMAHAQVNLVLGRVREAESDCALLDRVRAADEGLLCDAAIALRRGDADSTMALTRQWLALRPDVGDTMRYVLVMRGEAASLRGDADADRWFRGALALSPQDVRSLAAFARHLRAHGRDREAAALLAQAPGTDGLLLQQALAAQRAHLPGAARLARELGRRYALAHSVGSQPEMRDEADYLLQLRGQPLQALALAQRNFQQQRDREDIDVLVRAAVAARRPDAIAAVRAWAGPEGLEATLPRVSTP
jgi:hypothetical protein